MKAWKTTGLALAACLTFAAAACQAEVKDNTSKGSGVTITGDNDQSVTVRGDATNKSNGKNSGQNAGSNSATGDGSATHPSAAGNPPASGGAASSSDDWKEAAADRNATVATVVNGTATIAGSGGTVHVKDDVDKIDITGSGLTVVAKTAKKVTFRGSSVKLYIEQVSSIDFNGSDNDVEWANGAPPTINDKGTDNEVEKTD